MNGLLKQALTFFLPASRLKNVLLSQLFGWQIAKTAHIGHSRIDVHHLVMKDDAYIGRSNIIVGLSFLELKQGARIFLGNRITGFHYAKEGRLSVGEKSQVLRFNTLDCSDEILIGSNVTFGGVGSQLWTHGFDTQYDKFIGGIIILDNVYLGSSVIISPNIKVASSVSIAAGSVVTRAVDDPGFYGGNPAKYIKPLVDFSEREDLQEVGLLPNKKRIYKKNE